MYLLSYLFIIMNSYLFFNPYFNTFIVAKIVILFSYEVVY